MTTHLTSFQVQECIESDRSNLPPELGAHVRSCAQCRLEIEKSRSLDRWIKGIPLERVSPDFADRVVRRLGLHGSSSVVFTFLKNLAPIVALLLVLGAVVIVLSFTGVFHGSQVQQSVAATQSLYDAIGGKGTLVIESLNDWIGSYFSFAFTRSTYGLTAFLVGFFGIVALLDKVFFVNFVRRKG